MNILFLISSLPHLSSHGLYSDFIREVHANGHKVSVVSPMQKGQQEGVLEESGISIVRFKTGQLTGNTFFVQKGIAYFKLIYQYIIAVRKYLRNNKFDLIYINSLPLEVSVVAWYLKRKYKAKVYLMLCDFLWQDLVALKILKKWNPIIIYYRLLDVVLFRVSDYIGGLSEAYIEFAERYHSFIREKNTAVIFPWSVNEKVDKSDRILKDLCLQDKFVAIYGGNVGIAQNIDNIIDLAESCQEYENIIFIIVGNGAKIGEIKNKTQKRGIKNICFLDFMPKDQYLDLINVCDVGLISLNKNLGAPNFPSKTSTLFNFAIPVIASIDYVTDYGKYLEKYNMGLWSYSGDVDSFKNNLLRLYRQPNLKQLMGDNAHKFYSNNMTPIMAYSIFEKQIGTFIIK